MIHRGGTWNLRKGKAVKKVAALLREERLDWLAVVELTGKGPRLQRLLNRAARLHGWDHYAVVTAEDGDSALVIRHGIEWGAPRSHRMGGVEWERKAGRAGRHPARIMLSVRVGPYGGGYRVPVVHAPPKGSRRQPRRAQARAAYFDRLVEIVNRQDDRDNLTGIVPVGDWNLGRWSKAARQLMKRLDARPIGYGVDYAAATGLVRLSRHRKIGRFRGWSDHRPCVFTVTVPEKELQP